MILTPEVREDAIHWLARLRNGGPNELTDGEQVAMFAWVAAQVRGYVEGCRADGVPWSVWQASDRRKVGLWVAGDLGTDDPRAVVRLCARAGWPS